MLVLAASVLVIIALALLVVRPAIGIAFLLLVRPIVDMTWAKPLIATLNLPMLLGVLVPVIIISHALINTGRDRSIGKMPLATPWLIFSTYVVFFSSIIALVDGWLVGLDVCFRHLNGIVGFYMIQAWYRSEVDIRRLMLFIALAGAVPMVIGLYQIITGVQWIDAQVEGLARYVGLYHDAFTVRLYMMQTLLASLVYIAMHPRVGATRFSLVFAYCCGALVVVFKAYSKSAVLALCLWVVTWTIARRRFVILGAGVLIAILAGVYFSSEVTVEIARLFNKELSAMAGKGDLRLTFQGRWFAWAQLIDSWYRLPLIAQIFGSGHKSLDAHNDYVQLLMHGGLIGLFLYIALIAIIGMRVVRNLLKRQTVLNVAAAMAVIMWLLDSIGLVPSSYPPYQWFVWGMVGLALRVDSASSSSTDRFFVNFRPVTYFVHHRT